MTKKGRTVKKLRAKRKAGIPIRWRTKKLKAKIPIPWKTKKPHSKTGKRIWRKSRAS